jgi:lysophospholipase L1-like esterase
MDLLWDKLDLLLTKGEGQIRMMQIGGSHIQADIWSDRMRRRLQTFFPGNKGFRGFIFPAKMANTNNPWNFIPSWTGNWESLRNVQYQKTGSLGLSGMSVTTRDSSSMLTVEFRGGDYLTYELDRVKVFHETGKENFKIQLVDTQLVHRMFTDTVGGYTEIQFRDLQERLAIRFVKTDSLQNQFTLYGLSLENREPGITYDAIGVNGASVPSYLRCNLFEQQISVIKPDVVILSIGINDANTLNFNSTRYEANYDELVSRIRRANPDAIIIFTTNNDSYYKRKYPNKNALEVQKTMLRLGKKHNAVVWDMFTIMGGLGSIRLWQGNDLAANDRIHLTAKGYTFLADLMFNALLQEYDRKLAATGKKGQH